MANIKFAQSIAANCKVEVHNHHDHEVGAQVECMKYLLDKGCSAASASAFPTSPYKKIDGIGSSWPANRSSRQEGF